MEDAANIQVRFASSEFSEDEVRQALAEVLTEGTYTITQDQRNSEEDEFLEPVRHGFDPSGVVVSIAAGMISSALYDAIKYVVQGRRGRSTPNKNQATSPPAEIAEPQ